VYLIGLAKGWIFEAPFDTYPIDVGPPNVPEAEQPVDVNEAAEELAKLSQLFSEYKEKDADSPVVVEAGIPRIRNHAARIRVARSAGLAFT
jgi:hypothetical protein